MPTKVTIQDLSEEKEQLNRAVIYARYSSDRQKEASIEQQTRECMEYISRKGYELIKIYSDSAKSASKNVEKRKDFMNLIEDSANGEFDVVVAYSLDRISREEHGGFYGYENELNKNGVRIEYATQVFDDGYGGEISKAVHVTMAAEYVAQLRKNVVRGMRDNAMNGYFNGGRSLPVGFRLVGEERKSKRYEPVEETKEYIAKAFEMYASGDTTGDLMKYLNEHGIRNSQGKTLTRDTINRMLANPIYKGTKVTVFDNKVEHKMYIADDACEAIISEELWDRVQQQRKKRARTGASERTRGVYELRGKLFCGVCGEEMIADCVINKQGKKRSYYSCKNKKSKRTTDKTRCTKKNVPKESIEAAVMTIISDYIWNEDLIQRYISVAEEMDSIVTVNHRIPEVEKAIRTHKERMCRADDAYMDTGDKKWLEISKEESKAIEQFESELREITKLSKHSKNSKDFIEEINDLRDLWIELQKTPEGRTNIVKSFIERVEVFDSSPDDPDKYKLKIIIKTDSKSNYYAEVEAETNLLSRKQNTNGHHQNDSPFRVGHFALRNAKHENRKGRERSERNNPVNCFGARVRAVGATAPLSGRSRLGHHQNDSPFRVGHFALPITKTLPLRFSVKGVFNISRLRFCFFLFRGLLFRVFRFFRGAFAVELHGSLFKPWFNCFLIYYHKYCGKGYCQYNAQHAGDFAAQDYKHKGPHCGQAQ